MNNVQILYPVAAMVLLVAVVTGLMLKARLGEMAKRRIHPQKASTRAQTGAVLENTRAADNYLNLFEMPVLFYVLCLCIYVTNSVTPALLAGAWVYVALRCAHSYIHIVYNKVMHRFYAFIASVVLLVALWVQFVLQLASK
jgi:hypothetical protein